MVNVENIQEFIHERFERVKEDRCKRKLEEYLVELKKEYKYVCILGAGSLGRSIYITLERIGITVDFFCDNNYDERVKTYNFGPKLIRFEDLCKIKKDCLVFVSVSNKKQRYNEQINQQLRENGFENVIKDPIWWTIYRFMYDLESIEKEFFATRIAQLISLTDERESKEFITALVEYMLKDYKDINYQNTIDPFFSANQYFPEFMELSENECFVDAGAYTGDTFRDFAQATNGKYEHYYGFEMDRRNYEQLVETVNHEEASKANITLYPYGVYSEMGQATARENGDASRIFIGEEADMQVDLVKLDECLSGKRITYIKMDVENSEVPALEGARNIICKQKPKLAISMYHSLIQFLEIPVILKQMNPDYNIRYRMHTTVGHDIVCYAITN